MRHMHRLTDLYYSQQESVGVYFTYKRLLHVVTGNPST